MAYRAPTEQLGFVLKHIVGFPAVAATELFSDATDETMQAVLTEAGRIASEVYAPLNRLGDLHPARLENGKLVSSPGFAEAFGALAEGGWVGQSSDPDYGGMGLPLTLGIAVDEMLSGACMSLELASLLTQGLIVALQSHASDEMKALYLPRLNSGEWSGTMNLTEPQAGSDVGALTTKAEPVGGWHLSHHGTEDLYHMGRQ